MSSDVVQFGDLSYEQLREFCSVSQGAMIELAREVDVELLTKIAQRLITDGRALGRQIESGDPVILTRIEGMGSTPDLILARAAAMSAVGKILRDQGTGHFLNDLIDSTSLLDERPLMPNEDVGL